MKIERSIKYNQYPCVRWITVLKLNKKDSGQYLILVLLQEYTKVVNT